MKSIGKWVFLIGSASLVAILLTQTTRQLPPAVAQIAGGAPIASINQRYQTPRSYDADGLQELFDRVSRNGGVAYLPVGVYRINKTVRISGMGPFRIEGEGYGDWFNPTGSGFKCQPTRLLWTGPDGGTMLHIEKSIGQSIYNMQLDGNRKAGKLIHLTAEPGWGTGNQRFERVVFRDSDVAIQCGAREDEFNNGDIVYDEVAFVGCNTGLRVVNHQSVNHYFHTLYIQHTGLALDFQRGGNLFVSGWSGGTFDLLLKVGYGGPNAGIFHFLGGRPEMNGKTQRYARLVEAEPQDSAHVIFEGTQETGGPYDMKLPDNKDAAAFKLGPRATVNVRYHYHMRPALESTGGTYIDENSRWHGAPADQFAARRPAGRVEISQPADIKGAKLDSVNIDQ